VTAPSPPLAGVSRAHSCRDGYAANCRGTGAHYFARITCAACTLHATPYGNFRLPLRRYGIGQLTDLMHTVLTTIRSPGIPDATPLATHMTWLRRVALYARAGGTRPRCGGMLARCCAGALQPFVVPADRTLDVAGTGRNVHHPAAVTHHYFIYRDTLRRHMAHTFHHYQDHQAFAMCYRHLCSSRLNCACTTAPLMTTLLQLPSPHHTYSHTINLPSLGQLPPTILHAARTHCLCTPCPVLPSLLPSFPFTMGMRTGNTTHAAPSSRLTPLHWRMSHPTCPTHAASLNKPSSQPWGSSCHQAFYPPALSILVLPRAARFAASPVRAPPPPLPSGSRWRAACLDVPGSVRGTRAVACSETPPPPYFSPRTPAPPAASRTSGVRCINQHNTGPSPLARLPPVTACRTDGTATRSDAPCSWRLAPALAMVRVMTALFVSVVDGRQAAGAG